MTEVPWTSTTEHRGIIAAFREVRETPAPSSWPANRAGPPVPDERPEPVLAMANIQGNVVAGFNKDFQTLLYFHIDDALPFKKAVARARPPRGNGRGGAHLQPTVQADAQSPRLSGDAQVHLDQRRVLLRGAEEVEG